MRLATQEFDLVRSKDFGFHSVKSALIAKLKTKSSQVTEMCELKLHTGSYGYLVPIRMYETFMHTNNKEIHKQTSVVHLQ